MNKKTQKALAASKGRRVYWLSEEEAEVIDEIRIKKAIRRELAKKRAARVTCNWNCDAPAKRDGYCMIHWKMITRWGYEPAKYDFDRDGYGPPQAWPSDEDEKE
jgi:hypothetical protein